MTKRVLVTAAHPDDEILGVGGAAARMASEGDEVFCLILGEGLTSRTPRRADTDAAAVGALRKNTLEAAKLIGYSDVIFENLPDNRFDSVDLLDVVKKIEAHIERLHPHTVFTHFGGDLNIDHRVCFSAVLTATRPISASAPREVYAFETLSSTEWSFNEAFRPNVFVDISGQLPIKLKAMKCYPSELRSAPHPRSLEIIEAAAKRWGSAAGVSFAEAFELVRRII